MKSDNTQYYQMLKRMHKAAQKRVIDGDMADYAEYRDLVKEVNQGLTDLLRKMYDQGFTVVEIGKQLGVSKQAIYKTLKDCQAKNVEGIRGYDPTTW